MLENMNLKIQVDNFGETDFFSELSAAKTGRAKSPIQKKTEAAAAESWESQSDDLGRRCSEAKTPSFLPDLHCFCFSPAGSSDEEAQSICPSEMYSSLENSRVDLESLDPSAFTTPVPTLIETTLERLKRGLSFDFSSRDLSSLLTPSISSLNENSEGFLSEEEDWEFLPKKEDELFWKDYKTPQAEVSIHKFSVSELIEKLKSLSPSKKKRNLSSIPKIKTQKRFLIRRKNKFGKYTWHRRREVDEPCLKRKKLSKFVRKAVYPKRFHRTDFFTWSNFKALVKKTGTSCLLDQLKNS